MISIKIKNSDLDLFGGTSISIERESPIWFGGDIESIPGTVTIPFDIPLTKKNKSLLNFIHHLGNRKNLTQFENIEVQLHQNTHLSGTLEIEQINTDTISVKIYDGVGALQVFKNTYLNDAILYEVDDYYTLSVAMMNSSLSGEAALYLPVSEDDVIVNPWNVDTQTYADNVNVFVTVSALWLLEKVMSGQNWTLAWRNKGDFEDIYLMTNQLKSFFYNLTEVLPSVLVSDFIKQFAIATGHFIDIDSVNKVLTFRKYDDIGKGRIIDLTDKVINIDGQEFLSVAFDFDTSPHQFKVQTETETRTYGSGTINYSRNYFATKKELVSSFLVDANLDKIHLFRYEGLQNSSYTLGTGAVGDVESLQYPKFSSLSNIADEYESYIDKVSNTRLLTVTASLTTNDIKKMTFDKIIRIFNAKDGNYYNFVIKSIKQTITTQEELAELELVLLK